MKRVQTSSPWSSKTSYVPRRDVAFLLVSRDMKLPHLNRAFENGAIAYVTAGTSEELYSIKPAKLLPCIVRCVGVG
jgi:hypothetical protein